LWAVVPKADRASSSARPAQNSGRAPEGTRPLESFRRPMEVFQLASSAVAAELIDIAAGLFARLAVGLLDLADELISLPLHLLEVIVAQATPALPGLTFDLLPVAFDFIPVHRIVLRCRTQSGPW